MHVFLIIVAALVVFFAFYVWLRLTEPNKLMQATECKGGKLVPDGRDLAWGTCSKCKRFLSRAGFKGHKLPTKRH
jgi:hypothetical protein